MNRGRRGEDIFADKKDHEAFLVVLREAGSLFGIKVAAYCLMSNHYHLLMHTPDGNISRAMRHINGVYTQRYNRRLGIDGQLFRGRYKCVLVEADSHLLELLRYIHRNPVRAGMCKSVDDFVWSSHAGYLSRAKKWDWLAKDLLLAMFSKRPATASKEYRKFVQGKETSEVLEFYDKKNLPSIFGTDNFVQWVKDEFFERKRHPEIPQTGQLAPTVAEIKEAVCRSYGITEIELTKTKRGHVNEPRNLAIYLSRKITRSKLEDIGKEFALGNYSSVSSAVFRTESLLANNGLLRKKLAGIRENLSKSHAKT
jgi:REP element-mobilizing transposase RayT